MRRSRWFWWFVAPVLFIVVVGRALYDGHSPERCGSGWEAQGARCCAPGQRVDAEGSCRGKPTLCPSTHVLIDTACLPRQHRIRYEGGVLRVGPSDWEAQGIVQPQTLTVAAFSLDAYETTIAHYAACVRAGQCLGPVPPGEGGRGAMVTAEQASALCAADDGRLPTDDEWLMAAMGPKARRYPWGETGAVCARAAFGLSEGPCSWGASGPDTVGAHPAGRSPEGADDLAGNGPEWTRDGAGGWRWRGGSYASSLAAELRGWSWKTPTPGGVAGVRCAYE